MLVQRSILLLRASEFGSSNLPTPIKNGLKSILDRFNQPNY